MTREGARDPAVAPDGGFPSFRALLVIYLVLNALATAIDTLIWGWIGLIATGLGGLLLLAVLALVARVGRPAAR